MALHISDHAIFGNAWSTPELAALFDDRTQLAGWIEVLAMLAETEAEFGLIPKPAACGLAEACRRVVIDQAFLNEVREDFERTNHSLLGLIRALQRRCPGDSGEWLCYGATVQDISDTHTARTLAQVHGLLTDRLAAIAGLLAGLAGHHRDTPLCGRTHGQPGLPISFGFKAAGWLDEIQRHRLRMQEVRQRLTVGQLAGGVGSLSSFGPRALELQRRFLERLGLAIPAISWTASRDRLAEWLNLLALIAATCDRIGHEIYNLQRPEIGELAEGFAAGTVGSITMPQKRNPEISEHLGTLARTVRHLAAQMMENLVHDHERDGRSWKGEWAIVPTACLATGKALALLHDLLAGLEVREQRMAENLASTGGFVHAERLMLALAPALGKQSAHALVYRLAMEAAESGCGLLEAARRDAKVGAVLDEDHLHRRFDPAAGTGCCGLMVDRVLADRGEIVATEQPLGTPERWPLEAEALRSGIARLPRRPLAAFPTPLQPLQRLGEILGGLDLWCKRDDLIGFGFGGNKVRGLEFLVAEALDRGADTLVTGAGSQSNHVRVTAAAAACAGLDCVAVFWGEAPSRIDGNYRLTRMLGAQARFTGDADRASVDFGIEAACEELRRQGRRPYLIPRGGACALGTLGHALAALELFRQCREQEIALERVVLATGSGGTHAGWLLGTRALGWPWQVESYTVSREVEAARGQVIRLANEAAALLELEWRFTPEQAVIHGGFIGAGYGIPSPEAADAIRLVARSDGILLDPTYTGKAMAGLIEHRRQGLGPRRSAVFLHTGGEPAFFAGTGDWLE